MKIYVWADGAWCFSEEIDEFAHRSDDYTILDVPEDIENVDTWLSEQGLWT